MAHFWKSFQRSMGTQLMMSTAFHPQTDGQSERTIHVVEDIMRACVLDLKGSWDEHFPFVREAMSISDLLDGGGREVHHGFEFD